MARTVFAPLAWPARGVARTAKAVNRWRTDAANRARYEAACDASPGRYQQLRAAREAVIRQRTGVLLMAVGITYLAVLAVDTFLSAWMWQAALAVVMVGVTAAGRPARRPGIISSIAHRAAQAGEVTPDAVREALAAAVPDVAKALKVDPGAVRIVDPPSRDGPGWHVRVELPPGVTAAAIAAQQPELASAFRKPPLAVSVEPDPAHNGMVALWVGDQVPAGDVAWPLADSGEVDVLAGFPIGTDVRGRAVTLSLANQNGLIGAQPGYGKTATLRMILLAAALDPRTKVYAYDLKGGVDLLPLEPVAERVVAGDEPEDMEQLRDDLRGVRAEIRARNKMIRALPIDERPDGQITTADASRLGLAPVVFAIDEAQIAYADKTYGKEIEELTEDVFRRGRSVGIHVLLATQRFDTASVPRSVSTNATLRMCGRVDGFQESNMILGSNAHGQGVSATVFGPEDRGVMWVKGAGAPRIVRMARVTASQARVTAARALQVRQAAPVRLEFDLAALPAPAPKRPELPPAHDLPGRVQHVWPAGEDKLWTETILGLLREHFPGDYVETTPAELSRMLPGVPRQIKKNGANRKGYSLADISYPPATEVADPATSQTGCD